MEIKTRVEEKISSPDILAGIFKKILETENEFDIDKEHFWIVGLKSNNRVKFIELISIGTLNASLTHPREVFRPAVVRAAASIIIVHNHPSGDTSPSTEDKQITIRMVDVGKMMDIPILDHVIISEDGDYFSFKEERLIE
jgi:DNA repair protein RadC